MSDRTKGPWSNEPDTVAFEASGLRCEMVRHAILGHWCGYVSIPKGHPYFEQDYDTPEIDVHGGLTWARAFPGGENHPATDDWWFGFDCAHAGDLTPGSGLHSGDDVYRDMIYVRAECESLAAQLSAKAEGTND